MLHVKYRLYDDEIKMAREPWEKPKKNLVGRTGEGKIGKINIREGKTGTVLEVR